MVLFIMLHTVVLTFEPTDKPVKCDHSNESSRAVLISGAFLIFFLGHFKG